MPTDRRVRLRKIIRPSRSSEDDPPVSSAMKSGFEGNSIRHLRQAFQDTPERLRELEDGWRGRRKMMLAELSPNAVSKHGVDGLAGKLRVNGEAHGPKHCRKTIGAGAGARSDQFRSDQDAAQASRHHGALCDNHTIEMRPIRQYREYEQSNPIQDRIKVAPSSSVNVHRKVPKVPIQSSLPPTPPPTPPHQADVHPRCSSYARVRLDGKATTESNHILSRHSATLRLPNKRSQPILAHPLPPTAKPVPLTSTGGTIFVPPYGYGELVLAIEVNTPAPKTIHILKGGRTITIVPSSPRSTSPNEHICLDQENQWSTQGRKQWDLVQQIVEGFKRKTPRVKLYTSLGEMTITCSEPPDVFLNFVLDESCRDDDQPGDKAIRGRRSRVRVTYSRLGLELRIDTSTTWRRVPRYSTEVGDEATKQLRTEMHRSKRTVPLHPSLTGISGTMTQRKDADDQDNVRGHYGIECASAGVGVMSSLEGWSQAEMEGVQRIWALKGEWDRFR